MATISLRCSEREKRHFKIAADAQDITLSQFIILTCLDALESKHNKSTITPATTYKLHTLLNLLESELITKELFIERMREELAIWLN